MPAPPPRYGNCQFHPGTVRSRSPMNDEQLKIIRTLQWIFYPIALIMLAAFAWRMFGGQGSLLSEEMMSLVGSLEAGVMFHLAGLFWVVFAALAIECVGKEMSGVMAQTDMAAVRLEIGEGYKAVRSLMADSIRAAGGKTDLL